MLFRYDLLTSVSSACEYSMIAIVLFFVLACTVLNVQNLRKDQTLALYSLGSVLTQKKRPGIFLIFQYNIVVVRGVAVFFPH